MCFILNIKINRLRRSFRQRPKQVAILRFNINRIGKHQLFYIIDKVFLKFFPCINYAVIEIFRLFFKHILIFFSTYSTKYSFSLYEYQTVIFKLIGLNFKSMYDLSAHTLFVYFHFNFKLSSSATSLAVNK